MGPFVGFRISTTLGRTWTEPIDPSSRRPRDVTHSLFGERARAPIKIGAPHVIDFGAENQHAPYVYDATTPGSNP